MKEVYLNCAGSYYFSHYTKLLQPTTRLITTEIMASCGATVPTSEIRSTMHSPFYETQIAQARHEIANLQDVVQSAREHDEAAKKRVVKLEQSLGDMEANMVRLRDELKELVSMNQELAEKYEMSQREVMRLREDIARHREEDAVTIANMTVCNQHREDKMRAVQRDLNFTMERCKVLKGPCVRYVTSFVSCYGAGRFSD
jgi:septal ring factor EnvC (AmiA/AmiB activator)